MADKKIDCTGLNCPLPIVNIGKAFRQMQPGDTLEVEADDPAFKADVEAFATKLKCTILNINEGKTVKVVLRKEKD